MTGEKRKGSTADYNTLVEILQGIVSDAAETISEAMWAARIARTIPPMIAAKQPTYFITQQREALADHLFEVAKRLVWLGASGSAHPEPRFAPTKLEQLIAYADEVGIGLVVKESKPCRKKSARTIKPGAGR